MRRLAVLLLLLMLPIQAWSAIANVQCITGTWSSGTSWTASITATTGNLIVGSLHFWAGNLDNDVTTYGDGGTNTYTEVDTEFRAVPAVGNHRLTTFYAKSITGGALTFTVNTSTSVTDRALTVLCEVSGADATAPLDQHAEQYQVIPGTGTDAVSSGSVTTTTNGQYVYGATIAHIALTTYTQGTGFTSAGTGTGFAGAEYLIQSSAGSIAATFTQSVNTDVTTMIATFKAASVGAVRRRSIILQ